MKTKFLSMIALCVAAFSFVSCSEEEPGGSEGGNGDNTNPTGTVKMTLEGKVDDGTKEGVYANIVYVNLEAQAQQQVARKSWHLAFYCGKDNRVVLNQALSRAVSSNMTDFAAVTVKEAEAAPNLAGGMTDFPKDKLVYDDCSGDLNKTAFGEIAADPAKSEVFFLASGDMKDRATWFKVKVTAEGNGYKIEYGNVNDKTAKTAKISKASDNLFIGFSLETGKVVNLPAKWDLSWSYAMATTTMPNGKVFPGQAQDVITVNNHLNVETAVVKINEVCSYADFKKADLAKVKFQKEANVIGSDWRTPPMPNATAGPKDDRFYVFKSGNNFYKLHFLHFCEADGGERGRTELEYEILK